VDEHEERQVGQEVQQVQGGDALQLQPHGRILVDPPGLQLQEELLRADEASGGSSFFLLLQEEQEQLLHGDDDIGR